MWFCCQVDLTFSPESLLAIARLAMERKTGARGLRAIMVSFYTVTLLLKYFLYALCSLYVSFEVF